MAGYTDLGAVGFFGAGQFTFTDTWSWMESLNMLKGNHALRVGFDLRMFINDRLSPASSSGSFAFNQGFTQADPNRASADSGHSVASFLLGYPSNGSTRSTSTSSRTCATTPCTCRTTGASTTS